MHPRLEIRTQDPDLGRSVLLWAADLAEEYLGGAATARLIVDDGGLAGRPWRRGPADCSVVRQGDSVRLRCSSAALLLRRRPVVEAVRRALVRLGRCRDMTSIDHFRVVRQQRRVRELLRQALGIGRPEGPCRFLLRVDDFPSPWAGPDDFARFHAVAAEYGVPYLLAVTPFLDGRELTEHEVDLLRRCSREGVAFALHGFTHRSRYANFASELLSLPAAALRAEVERAERYLGERGLATVGFVAPFNGYDALTLGVLTERYPLICGGPESVLSLGYRVGPSFLMGRLYVPSYRGAYDVTAGGLAALDRLADEAVGLVVPVTLHWANEVKDGFRSFRALCARLTGATLAWGDYLARAEAVNFPCQNGRQS